MKHGYIKVAAATPHIKVADCAYNAGEIIAAIQKAQTLGVKVLVLPELCITGYTAGDLFYQDTLLDAAADSLLNIAKATAKKKMLVFVGLPVRHNGRIYNAAAAISDGRILGLVPKTYLPNYNEFYEKRHFAGAERCMLKITLGGEEYPLGTDILFTAKDMPRLIVSAEICEDLWVTSPPSIRHCEAGATVIVNLSASNELVGKVNYRQRLVEGQSARLVCGYIYASAGDGESTTDLVFGGHNLVAENGRILAETNLFENGFAVSEIDLESLVFERGKVSNYYKCAEGYQTVYFDIGKEDCTLTRTYYKHPFVPADTGELSERAELILTMQAQGLRKRIEHTGSKHVVIGLSGGLDSSLALLASARAMKLLGRSNSDIVGITMPAFGTTNGTLDNARRLAAALGVTFKEINISASVTAHLKEIGHTGDKNIAYENAQARERTQILMDYANMVGGLVVGTGDLSELALGWSTYNGDHMSMYGINAGVPKTLVQYLIRYEAIRDENLKEVLFAILDTPISPELLPPDEKGGIGQKTEEIIGPYELHDFFLYYLIRMGFPPSKVLRIASLSFKGDYDKKTIKKWLKMFITRFFANQFKRSCLPDGVKIGSVALSPRGDWRMPSDASPAEWLKELES